MMAAPHSLPVRAESKYDIIVFITSEIIVIKGLQNEG
jgi:hypothetical protein